MVEQRGTPSLSCVLRSGKASGGPGRFSPGSGTLSKKSCACPDGGPRICCVFQGWSNCREVGAYAIFFSSAGQPLLRLRVTWGISVFGWRWWQSWLEMWVSQKRSCEMLTPRYFSLSTLDRKTPHNSLKLKPEHSMPCLWWVCTVVILWYFVSITACERHHKHEWTNWNQPA